MRLFLLLALFLASCAAPAEKAAEPGSYRVGVTVLTMTHPFFLDLVDALQQEAAANGVEVLLVSGEFDIAKQQNQIADFIVQGVDALIITPTDSRAIGTSIAEANRAGIPVFTADIAALADGVEVVAHVGIDNYDGGRKAGEAVVRMLGGQGEVGIVDHPEVESVIQRTRGFRDAIDAANQAGSAVEIVSVLPGSGSMDKAFKATEDMLQAQPELDAIFGINDETALGALAAIEKAGRADRVRVIGFGGKKEAVEAVDRGALYADVITYPREIGRLSIQAVLAYMRGEAVPAIQLIPTELHEIQAP
ncbi:MAG: substrate-binding domain-containing protein [Rhodothermales bacterium]|nr:substrate-binding domain-containing protein [Rhodothermales bacterium]